MPKTTQLLPGVTLRCYTDHRFKQGCLSVQLVRQMCREEAALNALLPSVLLRGTATAPDLRAITLRLDELYGASVSGLARRIGDCQTTGFYCSFIEDRFALEGDRILAPFLTFLEELLLQPLTEAGIFSRAFVESEKVNLISTIEAQLNNKQAYADALMLQSLCREDSFGIPRLGTVREVSAITAEGLYGHYRRILAESPVELFYVGSMNPETVGSLLKPLFSRFSGNRLPLPPQTPFRPGTPGEIRKTMEITQGKLSMGFVTPIDTPAPRFAAMQLCGTLLGGVTGKLFTHLREELSLCYEISASYRPSKGILKVSAGIDPENEQKVRSLILRELEDCAAGKFSSEEAEAARQELLSGLQTVHDSPGSIEGYYATAALSARSRTPEEYARALEAVTPEQIAEAASTVRLHTVCFLKGGC